MKLSINTCVFPKGNFHNVKNYLDKYGDKIGIEILAKFDEDTFASELDASEAFLKKTHVGFHSPVWYCEPSAKVGTPEYASTKYHNDLTCEYARKLNCEYLIYHLNNCVADADKRFELLDTSLANLRELRAQFDFCPIYVENTGTPFDGTLLLNQEEFTSLCIRENFEVVCDIGHAIASGWDLDKLLEDLGGRIRVFHVHNNDGVRDLHNRIHDGIFDVPAFVRKACVAAPQSILTLEYTRAEYEGTPLMADLDILLDLIK